MQREYGCSALAVDWLSMVFMVTYTALALPGLRVTEQFGLRGGMVVGAALTAAGAWVRAWTPGSYAGLLAG